LVGLSLVTALSLSLWALFYNSKLQYMIQVYIAPGRYACHHFFVVKLQTTLLKLESIFEQIDTSFCAIQVII